MTILCNELSLEQINSALLRLQRSIQSNTNNFQNDVQKAVANVTVNSKNTVQRYDDSALRALISDLQSDYKNLRRDVSVNTGDILNLETILANVNFTYDEASNSITFGLGDYSTSFTLKDTTYTFSYDTETGDFTIVDNVTGETVFEETFNDTTYTFSFNNGILTIHNNLLDTDQTFNFDARYYTEAEIQSLILDKIPPEASASNQLADKNFVNSSISTATATFRGTVTSTSALAALTGDLNDYAYLQNIDPTTGQTISYDRYKWVETGGDYGHWKYEYTLNNSSFTSDQWAAINSGITCQIVTDLLDGCYTGHGSSLCKSSGNEWRNILATNCNCTGSVDADYIYYNTNVRVNQCTGALSATCYCVYDKGLVPFSKNNLTASSLGLTVGCCYPITCILDLLRCCFGNWPATYTFIFANNQNPMVCETGGYAYCLSFTKLDIVNVTGACWQRDHWLIEDHVTGTRWTASSYSSSTIGSWTWNLNRNATACRIYRNVTCDNANFPLFFAGNNTEGYGNANVSGSCQATFNPATGVLSAKCFVGAIDETKYPGACCTGTVRCGSFNGISGTVDNGLLSFNDINFDNICNSPSKNVAANNITRRYLLTNQITSVGYKTRWGLGLERGTTGWGTGLLSLGVKDDGTCFADYKFTSSGGISLTCCGTAKCITLSGCATKNVFTCCLGSASNTRRYYQIKTKANRGVSSVSFDFDFFSMNGTINLDNGNNNQYYAGAYYGNLCVSVCGYTCACCDCFWLTYMGYRSLTLKSVYDFEVLCNTTTAPEDVTFCCFVKRPGSVTKVGVSDDASYNILLSNAANDTAMPSIGSNCKLTFNPGTGILDVSCGTCIGWYRTKSCCVRVTPTAQSSCWIYIGRYQTNGTADTANTYNELNLTIAAVGNSMVSSANIKVLSANAVSPTVIVQRQCGYSASTGIDCVAVTRSGSTWNCYLCVWARVVSSGTCPYYLHLYRNMLPDSWTTALTLCSAITGDIVGVGNTSINSRAIQTNTVLRIGSLGCCTSSVAGCAGSSYGAGFMEMFAGTPYIDFHVNHACADCSSRIIANTGVLCFTVTNATGCTAPTQSSGFVMCSNGTLSVPQSIYGNNGRVLNLLFEKPDNSGRPVYRLLYEVTDWYNASSGIAGKGINGTFTQVRTNGYLSSGQTSVSAFVSYGRGNNDIACCQTNVANLTWATLGFATSTNVPYILKDTTNNKYYLAIRFLGSQHCEIFNGIAFSGTNTANLLTCNICATDANGTLPTGWQAVTIGARINHANLIYTTCTTANSGLPLLMGNENAWTCIYTNCAKLRANPSTGRIISCESRVNDYVMISCAESTSTGVLNNDQPGILLNKNCRGKMIQINGIAGVDKGLILSTCDDTSGTTYCNLGIELGSGNINRGFYHFKAGTFEWLQYWDAACERHACPQCFACPIYGCSSATFAGCVSACNTQRWSTVYSGNTYSTGYYLIAEYKTCENGSGNHDITIGGCVDIAGVTACKTIRFKASVRGNKCTVGVACAWVDSSLAADCLVFTRSVDTATCTFALRVYGRINAYYTRFNTTIDYLAAGDVNARKSNQSGCLTFPNTYAAAVADLCGTVITASCNCGVLVANSYKTNAASITCSFAAGSTSYILLGCYAPLNTAGCANELDLGFALGGGNLVEKGSLKLLLTTGSCSRFSNNNIEAKLSNYSDSSYGVRKLIFTSGGNSWNCSIGIWLQVCNPDSAACSWAVDLLRNKIDDRFTANLTCAASISGTRVCTIEVPTMRNFYYNNAEQNCFSNALTANALCSYSFNPLPTVICGNCNQCYIHLGCYRPTLMCANELDLTFTVGDSGNNSVNIKALLTTGCFNEFYKNNIRINTASLNRSNAHIDSILFTTVGTAWNCPINIYALVCSTAACTCYTLYSNKKDACFVRCFEALAGLPPAPLICSFPITGDSVTTFSAPLLISTWKQETCASASFALGCNSYTTLVIGGINDVRSPTYQKLLISTSITGSENPLNMWIDYMGGYGDKDFITACYSGANCNVIVPMRISSDSQNIYIDFATCICAARDICATIYSSCPMPLGSCGNAVRNTSYTACFITDASCAYCYVMCQWPTTITLNVDDPASQFATRILSANTISAYCMATTSDIRQKKDITPYNNGLCDISKLDIISFRYKNEDSSCIKHVSIPANWTNPLLSGEKQNQLRINDAVGILLGAVKDLSKSMTLSQKIKLWFYKKFIEPKNNDNIRKKLKDFN